MSYRIVLVVLVFSFYLRATDCLAQEVRPNLTGTWRLNVNKSKLVLTHPSRNDSYKIKDLEPRLEIEHEGNTYHYIMDKKVHVAFREWNGEVLMAKTYWDGETLVIEKSQEIGPGGTRSVSRYGLSKDRKSIAVTLHVNQSQFGPAFDEVFLYEKQP